MADDLKKVAITNNDQGPRYVWTARGQEVVAVGATLTTTASAAQVEAIEGATITGTDGVPMFTVERTSDPLDTGGDQGKALDSMTVAQLRSVADAEGVPLTGRTDGDGKPLPDLTKGADIITAIQAKRAAA